MELRVPSLEDVVHAGTCALLAIALVLGQLAVFVTLHGDQIRRLFGQPTGCL